MPNKAGWCAGASPTQRIARPFVFYTIVFVPLVSILAGKGEEEEKSEREAFPCALVMAMASLTPSLQVFFCLSLLVVVVVLVLLHKLLSALLWRPLRIQRVLRDQGIRGPPYCVLVGNFPEFSALRRAARASPMPHINHHITPRILPHYTAWSAQYGSPFLYWLGCQPRLTLPNPEHCKEVLSNKFGHYPKPEGRPHLKDILANGLVTLEGEKWAQHRRIVSPAFFLEKLKAMTPTIANLASDMLDTWQSQLQEAGNHKEINAHEDFKTLTADIIAHTAFGSSYAEGKRVFELQYEQQKLFGKLAISAYIPGNRFLPTTTNRHRWRLTKQITTTLEEIIHKRLGSSKAGLYGNDLLGLMMSAYREESQVSQKNLKMSLQEIIDECKTFFFAGHETTSSLLTWTVMLLAIHSEWQERAREEVLNLFGTHHPDVEALNQLKVVGMILYESLRLYPPAIGVFREASKDMKLGDTLIPGGTTFLVPILPLHVDPAFWGPNAHDFDPQRFADGVLNACKHPMAYLPFSTGPRNCVGQNFAMMEAKIVICMVLQRFRFHLSPGYKHAPTVVLTLQPEHGMQIILETC